MQYLGDGDSKGLMKVVQAKPYGDETQIDKLECVGHVQKRLGTRLRKLKRGMKGKKLSGGKSLGDRGRLSEEEKLQLCYGLSIRRHEGGRP